VFLIMTANVRRYVECPCLKIGRLALLLPIAELGLKNEFTNYFLESIKAALEKV
jgi:hypothetical protein